MAKEGQPISVEQAKILKLLGYKMSKFHLTVLTHRNKKGKIVETDAGKVYMSQRAAA